MSLTLSDFTDIVTNLLSHTVAFYQVLRDSILISSPVEISLFTALLGFVVLEFFIYIINKFRGEHVPNDSFSSTGKNPRPNQYGGYGNKQYGPQFDDKLYRGGPRR